MAKKNLEPMKEPGFKILPTVYTGETGKGMNKHVNRGHARVLIKVKQKYNKSTRSHTIVHFFIYTVRY